MVEKKPVSIRRQMVFSLIPILDMYASYKIQKFRLWFLIFWVAGITIGQLLDYAIYGEDYFDLETDIDLYPEPVYIMYSILYIILGSGIQLIVMRKWSISWNKNLATLSQEDTKFWVCPNCGSDTQMKDERQYCSSCKIYL